uniref:CSON002376 protein n=1 Tax=Culicoides sonorensis TaxID=179676 RepID=A0A336LRU1_CULSO
MVQKYMFSIFITILISQSNSSPTRTTLIDDEVQEIRSLCNDQNDPLSCLKFKAMNFLQTIFQQDSFKLSNDVEIRKNGLEDFNLSGRAETDTLDKIESFIQSHDVTVNIPFTGSKVTVSPRNIKENELLVNVKLPENNHNIGDARKSKLKKIAIPLMVFVLLKAMTLIPLALVCTAASINNKKIENNEELVSTIFTQCVGPSNMMVCLKEKVRTYLDSILSLSEIESRQFSSNNIDEDIFNRVTRIINTNEFKLKLPETFFEGINVKYSPDSGLDLETSPVEGRGHLLKKKLLLPVLLLLKLKMKALMPILVALIGFKAMKAFIMAKLALTLVLGFLLTQLIKKVGMKIPMQMNPMQMIQPPQPEYGAPIPPTTGSPSSSYEASNSWEGNNYNSRVWDNTNVGSSHNLAYSSYYSPSSSSNLNSNNYSGASYAGYSAPSSSVPTSSSLTTSTSSTSSSAKAY